MAVIRGPDAELVARGALALDLADVERRRQKLLEDARRRAEATLARATADAERVLRESREGGHREGYAEGIADGYQAGLEKGREEALAATTARIDTLVAAWASAIDEFEAARNEQIGLACRQIVALAAVAAEKVTKRACEIDRGVVAAQVEAALRLLGRASRPRVVVAAEDEAEVRALVPGIVSKLDVAEHVAVEAGDVRPGGCVVRTGRGGMIDAQIDSQLERVIAEAMPDLDRSLIDATAGDVAGGSGAALGGGGGGDGDGAEAAADAAQDGGDQA